MRAATGVQAGRFRRQPAEGQAVLVPSTPSLDFWDTFPLQHIPPKLPVARTTLTVASA